MSNQASIPDALDQEVTYISGFNSDGTLGATTHSTWNGNSPATFSTTSQQFKWGGSRAGTPGGTVTYAFVDQAHDNERFTEAEESTILAGLTLWSDEANIQFAPAVGGTTADVSFENGEAPGSLGVDFQHSNHPVGSLDVSDPGTVSIDVDTNGFFYGPIGKPFAERDGEALKLVMELEGTALGLGQAGPHFHYINYPAFSRDYNVPDTFTQFGPYDQQLYSLMSYIYPGFQNEPYYNQYPVHARFLFAQTPMMADILAAQRIYGAPTESALSGGQVFGFHCNISDGTQLFFDFTVNTQPVVTLFDTGHNNALDLSGFSSDSVVDLRQGHFSSCAGLVHNIGIALGTAIHRVVCGAGNDTIIGTNGNDIIVGGAGNDVMTGDGGHDTFVFRPHFGQDQITDFGVAGANKSKLDFVDSTFQSVGALLQHTSMSHGSTTIQVDAHDRVTLLGITTAELLAHRGDIMLG